MEDQRGPYIEGLARSGEPRQWWMGRSPEDPNELWYFETVMDDGCHTAVRQLAIEADGTRHAYSGAHLQDDWGFLTDEPIDPGWDGLSTISHEQFEGAWNATQS